MNNWLEQKLEVRGSRVEVQLSKTNRVAVVPRSGYGPKPRVASTLGEQVHVLLNPEWVAPVDATALR